MCSTDSFSQEPSSRGARTRSDEQGRIVGLTYWGQGGLRLSAPKDVSNLTNVAISYGTTLTRDDIEFLASLQNIEELSFGGNLDDEYVAIEGNIAPLAKLKRLEWLFLCKRDMHDRDLEFLRELPNLKALEFLTVPIQAVRMARRTDDSSPDDKGKRQPFQKCLRASTDHRSLPRLSDGRFKQTDISDTVTATVGIDLI